LSGEEERRVLVSYSANPRSERKHADLVISNFGTSYFILLAGQNLGASSYLG